MTQHYTSSYKIVPPGSLGRLLQWVYKLSAVLSWEHYIFQFACQISSELAHLIIQQTGDRKNTCVKGGPLPSWKLSSNFVSCGSSRSILLWVHAYVLLVASFRLLSDSESSLLENLKIPYWDNVLKYCRAGSCVRSSSADGLELSSWTQTVQLEPLSCKHARKGNLGPCTTCRPCQQLQTVGQGLQRILQHKCWLCVVLWTLTIRSSEWGTQVRSVEKIACSMVSHWYAHCRWRTLLSLHCLDMQWEAKASHPGQQDKKNTATHSKVNHYVTEFQEQVKRGAHLLAVVLTKNLPTNRSNA